MWVFLIRHCVGISQVASGFQSEGIVPYVAIDLVCLLQEVSSRASYIAIFNQKNILWILIINAMSPTFLMAQIMVLCGTTWMSVIELRNESGMLDSMRSFKNTLTNLFHSYFPLSI